MGVAQPGIQVRGGARIRLRVAMGAVVRPAADRVERLLPGWQHGDLCDLQE